MKSHLQGGVASIVQQGVVCPVLEQEHHLCRPFLQRSDVEGRVSVRIGRHAVNLGAVQEEKLAGHH